MSIKVRYDNFKLTNDPTPDQITSVKQAIRNDVSWGSHTNDFFAVEQACSNKSWKAFTPRYSFDGLTMPSAESFELTFRDDSFNLESEGIDHFIGTIAGDIILNNKLKSIDVADFSFSKNLAGFFPGPNLGMDQILQKFKAVDRPILAYSIKPRMGYSVEVFASIYEEVAKGKADIIEDDERMIDPVYCPFERRVERAEQLQSKYPTLYSANITGPVEKMKQRIDFADKHHIQFVKVDVLVCGFDALRDIACYIREKCSRRIAITVYPDVVGRYRNLSRLFILKMARLCGADIIYAGSPQWSRDSKYDSGIILELEKVFSRHKMLMDEIPWAPHVRSTMATMTNDFHAQRAEIVTLLMKQYLVHSKYAFYVGGGISSSKLGLTKATKNFIESITNAAHWDGQGDYSFSAVSEGGGADEFQNIDIGGMLRSLI